jgi:DNA-binding protein H-NS
VRIKGDVAGNRKLEQNYLTPGGIAMAKVNISRMDVQSLLNLRTQVDEALADRRTQLERQLRELGGGGEGGGRRRGPSPLAGKRVPPKYRSLSGETWAGRGARPHWLVAAIKGGRKLDDFLIDKSARKARKKRRSKR